VGRISRRFYDGLRSPLSPEWQWQILLLEKLGERNISVDVEVEGRDVDRCKPRIGSERLEERENVKLHVLSIARDIFGFVTGKGKGSSGRWGFSRLIIQRQVHYGYKR